MAKEKETKTRRLFVEARTLDETFCYAGGPDMDEMLEGLKNFMRSEIDDMAVDLCFGEDVERTIHLKLRLGS